MKFLFKIGFSIFIVAVIFEVIAYIFVPRGIIYDDDLNPLIVNHLHKLEFLDKDDKVLL